MSEQWITSGSWWPLLLPGWNPSSPNLLTAPDFRTLRGSRGVPCCSLSSTICKITRKTGLACESRSTSSAILERPFVQALLTPQHKFDLNLCSEVIQFLLILFQCVSACAKYLKTRFSLIQGHCGTFLPLSCFLDASLPRKICFYIESYHSKQLSVISFQSPTGSSIF